MLCNHSKLWYVEARAQKCIDLGVSFNPNRLLYHNVSRILVLVLFPNIFYFHVGILPVFLN